MSEMKKIRMGEASFNYSPETAYDVVRQII